MRIAFDTSALVKRYVRERGTERVVQLGTEATEVILSVICIPELLSTLNRLRRERKLTRKKYVAIKEALSANVAQATIVAITRSVVARSIEALEKAPLRALDAIHLATALDAACDLFVSADARQCKAARSLGLSVEQIIS